MRQTNLTLEQITELLNSKNTGGYPGCMLVNEIGQIFDEQKTRESEESLIALLDSIDSAYRVISFCYLYGDSRIQKKYHVLLSDFRLRPENQKLLSDIDAMILKSQK